MMKCHRCGATDCLFRVNDKGEEAIWACGRHRRLSPFQVWLWQKAREERQQAKGVS